MHSRKRESKGCSIKYNKAQEMSVVATLNAATAMEAPAVGSSACGTSDESISDNTVPADSTASIANNGTSTTVPVCRFFLRGICRFGALCRFSHDLSMDGASGFDSSTSSSDQQPSTSRMNWINAPVFVPTFITKVEDDCVENVAAATEDTARTWADVVGGGAACQSNNLVPYTAEPGTISTVCPYEPCPFGSYCAYSVHFELCEMCDNLCLHPTDQAQRRKHNQECLQHHEQAMELSFAIARSKDKTCGICFDTIMEKSGREKRFGILPNCNHIFCLECIRKWRQAKQFEHKITRSCPECRVSSDFVCPSAFWVETKEEKDKLLNDYRSALGVKDCKYFKKGEGKCPFGNKCFYKHALPDGKLVDVGCPKRARKMQRGANEFMDLLDIYLWEFVDQRDYHWLDLFASSSDDSDLSDWSDD